MDDSFVQVNDKGQTTSYVGRDAVKLYGVIALRACLMMYIRTNGRMIPTRGMTITRMLASAAALCGKQYKRGTSGIQQAIDDLTVWIEAAKASMPVVNGKGQTI